MSQPEMGFNMQKMSGASQKKEATKEMSKKRNDVRCIAKMKPQPEMGLNIRCQHQGCLGLLMLTPKKKKSLHISLNREFAFYGSHYHNHCITEYSQVFLNASASHMC